jgi:membrane protein YqaA with SNARE-associated domain
MPRPPFIDRLERALRRAADGRHDRYVPLIAAALSFASTFTMSSPATFVIITAVLLARARWKAIVLQSAIASALAGTLLFLLFRHLGWEQLQAQFPDMQSSAAWLRAVDWVEAWGVPALFVMAALPLPQAPAILLLAIGDHGGAEVLLAIFAGKIIKYGAVAWVTATFPAKVRAWLAERRR